MALAYINGATPEYRFIGTDNIENRAITYTDIANSSIIKEHLHQEIVNIIDAAVPNETVTETLNITGNNFNDFSITTDKFVPNTISSYDKLGVIPNILPDFPANESLYYSKIILRRHIKNGTITPNKVRPGTIGAVHFNKVQCITKNKLASGVINDTFLRLKPGEEYAYLSTDSTRKSFPFTARLLAPDFRLQRAQLGVASTNPYDMRSLHPIDAKDFEDKVYLALRKFGITG